MRLFNFVQSAVTTLLLCGVVSIANAEPANVYQQQGTTNETEDISQGIKSPSEIRSEIDNVETIEIESQKPINFYRKQVEVAELDFYDLYNSLAKEDKFRMYCRLETKVGSRIKRMRCYPQYYLSAYAQLSQEAMLKTSNYDLARGIVRQVPSAKDVEFLVQREQEEALKYVEKLVKEHPSLLKQLNVMNTALETYNAQKKLRE